jgi:hypothetical protein
MAKRPCEITKKDYHCTLVVMLISESLKSMPGILGFGNPNQAPTPVEAEPKFLWKKNLFESAPVFQQSLKDCNTHEGDCRHPCQVSLSMTQHAT